MDELEHPHWCDPVHCTATTPKPHYRAGETGYHRSAPVVLQHVPDIGYIVLDPEINPLTAHLAQPPAPWEIGPLLHLGTVEDPQAVSMPVDRAAVVLRQLSELLAAADR